MSKGNKTIGRDRLGRLIYKGDVLGNYKAVNGFDHWLMMQGLDGSPMGALTVDLEVDLDASPTRTNYDRYFSDLGTFEEVVAAMRKDAANSLDITIDQCWWDMGNPPWGKCSKFEDWLRERATL